MYFSIRSNGFTHEVPLFNEILVQSLYKTYFARDMCISMQNDVDVWKAILNKAKISYTFKIR